MSSRKRFFLLMFILYAGLDLFINFGDWHHFAWNLASFLIGLPLAYFKPNWFPKFKGISRSNPLLYVRSVMLMFCIQLISALLINQFFYTHEIIRESLNLIINIGVVYMVLHMLDNHPKDDENGFRAGVSRRFQEMMDKYHEIYPPQLIPVPA